MLTTRGGTIPMPSHHHAHGNGNGNDNDGEPTKSNPFVHFHPPSTINNSQHSIRSRTIRQLASSMSSSGNKGGSNSARRQRLLSNGNGSGDNNGAMDEETHTAFLMNDR